MDGNHTLANGNRDFHPYTTMSYQSGHADVWSGESFPRFPCVYWVAVPQALRARRPNRLLHLPPQAQGLHPLTREPAAPWRAPHNGGQPERGRGRPRRGAGQPDEAAEGRRRVSGGPPACVVCVVRVVPPAHTHARVRARVRGLACAGNCVLSARAGMGAGGDNGIDHNKNCLRFPDISTFWRSHYLHPHPYTVHTLA
jgi:hypothetical protein